MARWSSGGPEEECPHSRVFTTRLAFVARGGRRGQSHGTAVAQGPGDGKNASLKRVREYRVAGTVVCSANSNSPTCATLLSCDGIVE